jgi:hypothetical protein
MIEEITVHESPAGRILEYRAEGTSLGNVPCSLEMIAAARGQRAEWIAVPIERLGEAFFQLRSGVAGEVLQKFATYHLHVAIVGDISALSRAGNALHDFVIECNRGSSVCFVRNLEDLKRRLEDRPGIVH